MTTAGNWFSRYSTLDRLWPHLTPPYRTVLPSTNRCRRQTSQSHPWWWPCSVCGPHGHCRTWRNSSLLACSAASLIGGRGFRWECSYPGQTRPRILAWASVGWPGPDPRYCRLMKSDSWLPSYCSPPCEPHRRTRHWEWPPRGKCVKTAAKKKKKTGSRLKVCRWWKCAWTLTFGLMGCYSAHTLVKKKYTKMFWILH